MSRGKPHRLAGLLLALPFLLLPKAATAAFLMLNLDSSVAPGLQGWAHLSDATTTSVQRQQGASPFIQLPELPAHGPGISGSDPLMPQQWLQRHFQWVQAFSHMRETSRRADASERILDFLRKAAAQAQRLQRVGTPNAKLDMELPIFDERVQFVDLMLDMPEPVMQDLPAHLLDDGALGEEPERMGGPEPQAADAILDTVITGRRVAFFGQTDLRDLLIPPAPYYKSPYGTPAYYIKAWDRRLLTFQAPKAASPHVLPGPQTPKPRYTGPQWSDGDRHRSSGFETAAPRPTRSHAPDISLWSFLGIIMDSVVSSPMTYVVFAFVVVFWVILRTVGGRRSL